MSKLGNTHHVVPNPEGGWDVRRAKSERSSGHYDTQKEAISVGRQLSRNAGTELKIHNQQGQIRESDSHGSDPFPPKG